jgi:PiT family inorganic phosphate transporter
MSGVPLAVVVTIAVALVFDFLNGFHDAANSIATVVSTHVLSPRVAVVWATFFNFIAFLFFGVHVAHTMGEDVILPVIVDVPVIASALAGAVVWNLVTWYVGLPSSSSHALVGGLCGAGLLKAGPGALRWGGIGKIAASIVLSPILGLALASVLMIAVVCACYRMPARRGALVFRRLQIVSAALYSLGHGGNDAQKTMGVIAVLLYSTGSLGDRFHVPLWVVLACHAALGLGTLSGGWRIVRTVGTRITKLKPVHGFCAETAGAATLFLATGLGIPVSTTHTISGAIVGVGSVTRASSVRWPVAARIVIAWVLTMPAAGLIAATCFAALRRLLG